MKKLLLKFADQVLSREELKSLKGGDGPYGSDSGCGSCKNEFGTGGCVRNGAGGCNCLIAARNSCSGS